MEALEFIRTLQELCTVRNCYDCPLGEKGRCIIIHAVNPEESVRIVEEWAAEQERQKPEQEREQERPKRTNKDVLLAAFQDARVDDDGIPVACPLALDAQYDCNEFKNCSVCRRAHWLAEAQE